MYRFILLVLIGNVCAYNVLVVFPYPGKSHSILGEGYVRVLLEAGHDVTYITPFLIKPSHPKLRQIDVSSSRDSFPLEQALDITKILKSEIDLTDMGTMYAIMQDIANQSITHPNVQKLMLDTNEQFDVAIVEWLYSDLYSGFSTVFNCPYIWSSSLEPHAMILRLIDDMPNPAYIPDHMADINPPLTFVQRVGELWRIIDVSYKRWLLADKEETIFNEGYGPAVAKRGRQLPPYEEVKYNGSMVLANSHVSSGLPIRLPQNHIPISGYHINPVVQPLPQNLQKIMDDAVDGVIYFSMGSMMKGKTMPDDMKREFLKTFSGLKQTVIWKLEEKLANLPKNVHIVQWAPQQSILAHPNCILFITHGGLLSTTETLHFGVPIIGIPLFADQFINIKRAVGKGFALQVNIGYDTPRKLKSAITEVLGNPKYREKVKELSLIYHDRPVKPGQELVHWVEHVAKTKGARHLRSPALTTPWYQKIYLDLLVVILLVVAVAFKIVKKILRGVFGKKVRKAKRN